MLTASQAEKKIFEAKENKEYLAIEGLESFRKATVDLLLGSDHPAIKEVWKGNMRLILACLPSGGPPHPIRAVWQRSNLCLGRVRSGLEQASSHVSSRCVMMTELSE